MTHRQDTSPLEDQIAENLRRAYRQRVEEEVPDRFRDLLRMLKEQDEQPDSAEGEAKEPPNVEG